MYTHSRLRTLVKTLQIIRAKPVLKNILVDLHAHWLPGVDDGVSNINESLEIIRTFERIGLKKLICTPHINNSTYINKPGDLLAVFKTVKKRVQNENIDIKLDLAAEYMLDDGFLSNLRDHNILTIGENMVLIELPNFKLSHDLDELFFEMQLQGFKPILAHPERYTYFQNDISKFSQLRRSGCLFQLNLSSISKVARPDIRKCAKMILSQGWYEYVATDIHSPTQLKSLEKIRSSYRFLNSTLL